MISKALITKASRQLAKQGGGAQITGSLSDLVSAVKDYQNTRAVETTKRAQIAADRDIRLAAIQAQADIFHDLVHKTFAERAHNFDQFFTQLKEGFASNNDRQIDVALTMIVTQIKTSPMAQAALLMQQINDPDVKRIEI